MCQVSTAPVILFPRDLLTATPIDPGNTIKTVMAITDHLAGDDQLVNYALRLTPASGQLILTHVEDDSTFERYMSVIAKIASIDTDDARRDILNRLLKDPRDYVDSCVRVVEALSLPMTLIPHVSVGHTLHDQRQLIEEHGVDLLLMHTKDDDQLAMHGMAYPLSVELRETPLLLL